MPWGCLSGVADPPQVSIDPNGNLTSKTEGTDTWAYEWNARNELTRVTKNSVEQARFSYDPLGRRVDKLAGGVTTTYTYDEQDTLREIRGTTTVKFVYGSRMDEPIAADDGTTLAYLHADALGSVLKTTDAVGAVTFARQYDAWGNLEVGGSEGGYAYTGREWDPEAQLYYYRTRYYDATLGRFTSEDMVGWLGGKNSFAYVSNNPANLADPLGLTPRATCPCLEGRSGASPKTDAGVCCKGGVYVICFKSSWYFGANSLQRRCAERHEQTHIDDMKRLGRPCDLSEPCQIMAMPTMDRNESECDGWTKEYLCLRSGGDETAEMAVKAAGYFCALVKLQRWGSKR